MPLPLVAIALGAGAGLVSGYVIDHIVGDGQYTAEEAVLDATLGVVGGSLLRPAVRIGNRARKALRVSEGKPSTFQRLAYRAQTDPVNWGSRSQQAVWIANRTARHSRRDLWRLAKFATVSGGHSAYLSRGLGAPVVIQSQQHRKDPPLDAFRDRGAPTASQWMPGRGRDAARTKWAAARSTQSKQKRRYSGKRRCPPGHYRNRAGRCVRYKRS